MTGRGFIAVFQKCFNEEIQRSAELQQLVGRLGAVANLFLFRRVVGPLASAVQANLRDGGRLVSGGVCLADDQLRQLGSGGWRLASRVVAAPVAGAGHLLHRGVLALGRAVWPGSEYRYPLAVHGWGQVGRAVATRGGCSRADLHQFIPAVIAGAKYRDLAQAYSPHAWRHLTTGYGTGELLAVRQLQINRRSAQPQITFTADMYHEPQDRVFTTQNTWTLSREPDGDQFRYQIHKAEITELL